MSRIASCAASISVATMVFFGGTALGRSPVAVPLPASSSSAVQAPDTSAGTELLKSDQAVCDKFYGTMDSKKKNAALKNEAATVTAIEHIRVILMERDAEVVGEPMSAAMPTLDEAESKIEAELPKADKSWYALIRKHRYDHDHKYAPLCPTASH